MKKKRLILFMPTIDIGGVEKNFIIISNFLSKKIRNISVITTSFQKKKKFSNNIKFISLNFINIQNFPRRFKFLLGILILFIELIKNKNSIVFSFQANIYCIFLCKLFNVKVIVRSNSSPTAWSNNIIKKKLYQIAFSLADDVIVNSKEFKSLFKKKFNKNPKVIYNPVNKKEIIRLSKKKINFDFFKPEFINFINVARLEDQKDHLTLLEAFAKLKLKFKVRLLIIGNGKNLNKIEKYIIKNNLSKNIKIILNENNPYPFIKLSDFVILTSIYEGLPNVLLEGICLKKLIISSDCATGPKEILDYGKGGILFKMKNSNDLYKKVSFIINNKKQKIKKINFANKRLNRFDYEYNLNKYLKLIEKTSNQ